MKTKNDILGFYYPAKDLGWTWEWWFNLNGGFPAWIYKTWEVKSNSSPTIWSGIIILGFKKLKITYTCSPEEALEHWKGGSKRLFDYLEDLIKNPNLDDDIEDTRLFKF